MSTKSTTYHSLKQIIFENGTYIPFYINGVCSEPHWQKILYARIENYKIEFLLTSGSHSDSISVKLYNLVLGCFSEESIHGHYGCFNNKEEFMKPEIFHAVSLFMFLMNEKKLNNNSWMGKDVIVGLEDVKEG